MKSLSVIKAKISRLKLNSEASKLFEELEKDKQATIQKNIKYIVDEEPIFAFLDFKYWWMITNKRLIINDNNEIALITFEDMVGVHVKELFDGKTTNEDCEEIQILLKNKVELNLKVERHTWFSALNLFKFLTA